MQYISTKTKCKNFDLKEEDLMKLCPEETAREQKQSALESFFHLSNSFRPSSRYSFDLDHGQMLGIIGGTGSGIHPGSVIESLVCSGQGKWPSFIRSSTKLLGGGKADAFCCPTKAEALWNHPLDLCLEWKICQPDEDLCDPRNAQAADFVRERRTTRWASGSLWSNFSRRPTSAVDHCACPFEE